MTHSPIDTNPDPFEWERLRERRDDNFQSVCLSHSEGEEEEKEEEGEEEEVNQTVFHSRCFSFGSEGNTCDWQTSGFEGIYLMAYT